MPRRPGGRTGRPLPWPLPRLSAADGSRLSAEAPAAPMMVAAVAPAATPRMLRRLSLLASSRSSGVRLMVT
ncbi:hypothetical protein ACVWXU_002249 [Streptomyces sp. TE33382]